MMTLSGEGCHATHASKRDPRLCTHHGPACWKGRHDLSMGGPSHSCPRLVTQHSLHTYQGPGTVLGANETSVDEQIRPSLPSWNSGKTDYSYSRSVVSDCLQPHGLQHTRLPCPSPTPGACSNPCPLSWRCRPTISFSVIPFSSCLQSFPASGSFPVSQFFASGDQSIGASASASVLPMNIQD